MTSIEWVQDANGNKGKTWNPIVGCSKVSPGCQNCYAINQAYRNAAMGAKLDNPGRLAYYEGLTEKRGKGNRVDWTGKVAFVPEALEIPLKTKKPTTWFVNSMSDLFHESVTDEQLDQMFAVMALTPQHTYQVLTKRPERMLEYMDWCERRHTQGKPTSFCRVDAVEAVCISSAADGIPRPSFEIRQWPLPNVWLGCTVENQATADERIPLLLQTPAAVRFLSCEPLLEEIDISEFLNNVIRQTPRRNNLSGGTGRGVGNRHSGASMEGGQAGMGSLESMRSVKQVSEGESRNNHEGLFIDQGDVRPKAISDGSASTGVSTFQRVDTRRNDDQPQGWDQTQQSSIELGMCNISAKRNPCRSYPKEGQDAKSIRDGKPCCNTDDSASSGYTSSSSGGGKAEGYCSSLRNCVSDRIEDLQGHQSDSGFWVIVGGESGPKARPCDIGWIRSIVEQCKAAGVPCFVKQLGSKPKLQVHDCHNPPANWADYGSTGKGNNTDQWPEDLRVRQMPEVPQCQP